MTNTIKLCKVDLFSTSPNLCQRTTIDIKLDYLTTLTTLT